MKRRDVLKSLSLLPLVGTVEAKSIMNPFSAPAEADGVPNLFEELGVTPYINASATMTFLSGSLMLPEVMAAINSTASDFANMYELQDKVGAKIAEMLKCEAAMVTSGAAGALVLGTAACITGMDRKKIKMLPQLEGPQREVIMQKKHRYAFDQTVIMTGAKIVEVENAEEMERAINENTVMALFFNGAISWYGGEDAIKHEEFIAICKRHNIPSFVDAAADVPPVENLFKYQKMGFDLVTFSGGKMIRGPQSAGLLFGRKDLIEAAKQNNSPHESPIGRPMKVNKEEIFGMYAALKSYLARDHKKEWQLWLDRITYIQNQLETIPTVKGETTVPEGPANVMPGLQLTWDEKRVKITGDEVSKQLEAGKPAIIIRGQGNSLSVGVTLLRDDQVAIVAQRVKEVLESALQKA
ncbi:aminotransferase class V-fold PLP-dependent enzyme [Parapedobacter lycopersici]|uniref:aminotransferase class V-fold PLP-dependent enzyme n=1 Tax=Parapedobacter lycopersici TaxID=1864939 RepID=UPI00214DB202|nr:aminotransferase class V-fold PLP-dependent enzyme [Parapedobacter lycopersici]